MKLTLQNMLVLSIGLVLGLTLAITQGVFAERNSQPVISLPVDELRTFTEVFAKIKNDYVEIVDDKTLLENAIRGMLSGLDPHSNYLDADGYKELRVGTTGRFGGLGIEVGMEDGFVKVISPIDDTPAKRAGVMAGDLIVRLDDTPVKGLSLSDAVKVMRGKPGSEIVLTVVREGNDQPLKITIIRDIIRVKSVKSRMLDDAFGYVRIASFQSKTGESLLEELKKLKDEAKDGLKGLVLDLRDNPGGVLNAAVEVSDAFLSKGLIVYTEGRNETSRMEFTATPSDVLDNAPIVILVNGGSASASEIVAGALQDHRRAIIMGSQTFGKGSVQTILPMNSNAALKLTTARYYTPEGRSIQAEGIVPHIKLERVEVSKVETDFKRVTEANLLGHLIGDREAEGKSTDKVEEPTEELVNDDYHLYEALNALKAIQISNLAKK